MLQKNNATPTAKHLVSDSYNKHLKWYEQNIEQMPEGIRVSMDEYKNMLLQAQEQRALHPISMEQYRLSLDQYLSEQVVLLGEV